ncbi:trypsin-like serine protease [Sorangium cellulosum]|uniref:trypsin-like serine protease n=1 Tax=Sorangium cellulosum TaxID=56 RepID=UPI003D9A6A56
MSDNKDSNGRLAMGGPGLVWIRTGAAGALLALATVGCSAADPSDDFSDEPLGTGAQEVRAGTPGGGVGTVEVGLCTGTLLGRHMILTAAHCFDAELGSALSGTVNTKISYAHAGGTWSCMTGSPASGKCLTNRAVFVHRYQQGSDAKYDLAVVFTNTIGGAFENVTAADAADGFYTGSLSPAESYRHYGRGYYDPDGTGAGIMRYMDDSLNWVGERHFVTDAGYDRICIGDSGGPYFLKDGEIATKWTFGIQSNFDSTGAWCVDEGDKFRGMRLTPFRASQINDYRADRGLPPCVHPSSSSPDFWVCQ